MLEVLDPEQFYFESLFEWSTICPMLCSLRQQILLICQDRTDRKEVIQLSGYTEDEKPRSQKDILLRNKLKHGLDEKEFYLRIKVL